MPVLNVHFLGRLGNSLFTYAFARAFAERNGLELHTDDWPGRRIWQLEEPLCIGDLPRKDEYDIKDGDRDISIRSYCQQQRCLDLYSRADCKRWFQLRPQFARWAEHHCTRDYVAHHRRGDYFWDGSAYPVVSLQSYQAAFKRFFPAAHTLEIVSEENPVIEPSFGSELAMLPDFLRLMYAGKAIFRANSSFSWWAAALSDAQVFSPVCAHLHGGQIHDNVEFVEGNWPRLAGFEYTTDLRLKD